MEAINKKAINNKEIIEEECGFSPFLYLFYLLIFEQILHLKMEAIQMGQFI
jgi:hypothetical protein